jgi:hypothetical protein
VVLDLLLIPAHGALGAAAASTAAYLTTDALLIVLLLRLSRRTRYSAVPVAEVSS